MGCVALVVAWVGSNWLRRLASSTRDGSNSSAALKSEWAPLKLCTVYLHASE